MEANRCSKQGGKVKFRLKVQETKNRGKLKVWTRVDVSCVLMRSKATWQSSVSNRKRKLSIIFAMVSITGSHVLASAACEIYSFGSPLTIVIVSRLTTTRIKKHKNRRLSIENPAVRFVLQLLQLINHQFKYFCYIAPDIRIRMMCFRHIN